MYNDCGGYGLMFLLVDYNEGSPKTMKASERCLFSGD